MPRGVDSSYGTSSYGTGSGMGGNQNFSVYDNSYNPFAETSTLPTEAGGFNFNAQITDPNLNNVSGAGAVGQGSGANQWLNVDEYDMQGLDPFSTFEEGRRTLPTFSEIREGISNWYDGIPEAVGNFAENIPIWKIGKKAYDGTLMSAAGDWLGEWADSPWNPLNWENGDPPEWSVSVEGVDGAPSTIASGTFNTDYIENLGYRRTSGGYSLAAQSGGAEVGDTLTTSGGGTVGLGGRKLPQAGEEGYIHYGRDPLNPEDLEIPEGSFFNYITNQVESIQGDPYAYRRIDASNAWLNAGINDLKLTDEQWANATEEEKQANWEARQEAAAADTYNFGTQGADPFGSITNVSWDKDVSGLEEAYLNGEYTVADLSRYYDGLKRSQAGKSATNEALPEFEEMLTSVGLSEEEIDVFSDSFEDDNTIGTSSEDTGVPRPADYTSETDFLNAVAGYRISTGEYDLTPDDYSAWGNYQDEFFNEFEDSVDSFANVDEDLAYTAYDLYDNKQEENYSQTFSDLDELSVGDTEAFETAYYDLDINMRNAYLSELLADGRIDEESYKNSVITNLIKDGQVLSELPDGTIITGTSLYEDHRILEFPELENKEYTEEEINYARRHNLDLEASYGTDSPTSFEQGTDEWNDRRERIARLDAGNVRFSAEVEGLDLPEKEEWWEGGLEDQLKAGLKTIGLNWLTSGLYSGVPAAKNILNGEGNSEDWKAIAPVFLKSTGAITEDTGIGGLTPKDTMTVVDALIDQDLATVVVTVVTPTILNTALKDVGVPDVLVDDPDFIEGFKKTVIEYYGGDDIQQAIEDGFVKYIREGGSLGDLPDLDLEGIDYTFGLDFDYTFGLDFDYDGNIDTYLGWIEDGFRVVGRVIDDAVNAVADAAEPIIDLADDAIDAVGKVIEEVKDALPTGTTPEIDIDLPEIDIDLPEIDIDLPTVDLPTVDLPTVDVPTVDLPTVDIDLPSVDVPSVDIDLPSGGSSPTKTTDYAFSDLFRFDTQIGISPYEELLNTDPFGRTI
tara:strand:- start:133 stop:3183 length:3051 start_codon:yes stop_codon:yes gene_type:complete